MFITFLPLVLHKKNSTRYLTRVSASMLTRSGVVGQDSIPYVTPVPSDSDSTPYAHKLVKRCC